MKTLSVILLAILVFSSAKAQQADSTKSLPDDTGVFIAVERQPEFPGGMEKFYRFLAMTIRYPKEAFSNHIEGKVILQLVVEKDGSLSNIKVIRSATKLLDDEALRIMGLCPKWMPGMQNGVTARVLYTMPITFKIDPVVHISQETN